MNSKLKKSLFIVAFLTALIVFISPIFQRLKSGTQAKTNIAFKGFGKGGRLLLCRSDNPQNAGYYSIKTSQGESANAVVKRMAKEVASSDTLIHFNRSMRPDSNHIATTRKAESVFRL